MCSRISRIAVSVRHVWRGPGESSAAALPLSEHPATAFHIKNTAGDLFRQGRGSGRSAPGQIIKANSIHKRRPRSLIPAGAPVRGLELHRTAETISLPCSSQSAYRASEALRKEAPWADAANAGPVGHAAGIRPLISPGTLGACCEIILQRAWILGPLVGIASGQKAGIPQSPTLFQAPVFGPFHRAITLMYVRKIIDSILS
ncbi:hypothetical protein AAFF_G00153310 [Aldrovandia affinis]|uniref:Uncharacterized protein n=1 Tax=Aldrovandia affinis TaxID=143900 RepID=A0AAD7T0B5_9TELE|nr:hypothetical protein AAFF_G00153310 [Aldrovandia affinis]